MQQLEERNTCTPTDIPHIRSNCGLPLNREETLSVSDLKTSSNISDAALTASLIRRTELVSFCHSYQKATESGTRLPIRYSATNDMGAGYAPPPSEECGFRYPCTPRRIMKTLPVPEIKNITKRPADILNPERGQKMKNKICTTCSKPITGFRDSLSQEEWIISGLCQKCQDKVSEQQEED